jgi:hypothetical protein
MNVRFPRRTLLALACLPPLSCHSTGTAESTNRDLHGPADVKDYIARLESPARVKGSPARSW